MAAKGGPKRGAAGGWTGPLEQARPQCGWEGKCLRFIVSGAGWIWWGTTAAESEGKGRR